MRSLTRLKDIEDFLSELDRFEGRKMGDLSWALEQHSTSPQVAAVLFHALAQRRLLEGRVCCDLGSGKGVLAMGCLLTGCSKVYSVEYCKDQCEYQAQTFQDIGFEAERYCIVNQNVKHLTLPEKVYFTVTNPPFGTKKHAVLEDVGRKTKELLAGLQDVFMSDLQFVEKALELGSRFVVSFHKAECREFVIEWLQKRNCSYELLTEEVNFGAHQHTNARGQHVVLFESEAVRGARNPRRKEEELGARRRAARQDWRLREEQQCKFKHGGGTGKGCLEVDIFLIENRGWQ